MGAFIDTHASWNDHRDPTLHPAGADGAEHLEAIRVLRRYGADPARGAKTDRAAARFFSRLQRRFAPLVGPNGYRGLLEQALARALERHPVLERWSVTSEGGPLTSDLEDTATANGKGTDPAEIWDGLVAFTAEFLALSHALARHERTKAPDAAPPFAGEHASVAAAAPSPGSNHPNSGSPRPWRILLLDQDLATCQAMAQALDGARDLQVVGYALDPGELEKQLDDRDADFVVVSGHLPSNVVLEFCRSRRREHAGERPHVVVTGLPPDDGLILRFLEAGAAAYTMGELSVQGLRLTLRLLARGESVFPLHLQHLISLRLSELAEVARERGLNLDRLSSLTSRERDVLVLLEERRTNRDIARRLFISEGTVKSHVHQILRKLKVRDRTEAARMLRLQRGDSS